MRSGFTDVHAAGAAVLTVLALVRGPTRPPERTRADRRDLGARRAAYSPAGDVELALEQPPDMWRE